MTGQEWAIITALFGAIVSLIAWIWTDSRKRDASDKAEVREMIKSFSARVDGQFADIAGRLQQQGERIASLATQQASTEKRLDAVQQDAHSLEVSFVRIAEQVAGLRGRLGLASPSGGMPATPPPRR